MATTVGSELMSGNVTVSLEGLMKETKWRVRHAVIKLMASLAKEFGKDFYSKNVESIFIQFLTDNVSAVREAGIEQVKVLADTFKADWVINSYVPKAVEVLNRDKLGYLYRITILNSIAVLVS
eukprot:TRINITY_DN16992_c0_g1_i1.p2 TRINITY_DN16992_c0_g1~~TRINITY_DN16992_c0_g1_i1.p2  ORF type:complete len:123 (-),score=30.46 TRINITY_DN16992_c0_g1_i1:353-721(-)